MFFLSFSSRRSGYALWGPGGFAVYSFRVAGIWRRVAVRISGLLGSWVEGFRVRPMPSS